MGRGENVGPRPAVKSNEDKQKKDGNSSDFAIKALTMILAAENGSFPSELDMGDNFHHVEEENGDDLDDGFSSEDSDSSDEFPDPYDQKRLEAIPRGATCTIAMNRIFRERLKHLLGKNHFDFVVSVSRKAFAARKAILKATSAHFSQIEDGADSFDLDSDVDTEALGSLFKIIHNVSTRMKVEELDAAVDLARELEVHALHDFDLLSVMPEMRRSSPPIGKALTPSGILFEQRTFSKPLPPGLAVKRKRTEDSGMSSPGRQPSPKRQKLTKLLSPMRIPSSPKNLTLKSSSEVSLPDCCKNNTICEARHILKRFGLRINSEKLATRVDHNCEPSRRAIEAFRKKHGELVEIMYKLVGRKMREESVEAVGMLLRAHAVIVAAQSQMRLRDGIETGSLREAESKLLSMERLVNQLLAKKEEDDDARAVEYMERTYLEKNAAKRRDRMKMRNIL